MYEQLSVLKVVVKDYVQRFCDEILTNELPPKREHMLLLRLSPLQRRLYKVLLAVSKLAIGTWTQDLIDNRQVPSCGQVIATRTLAAKGMCWQLSNAKTRLTQRTTALDNQCMKQERKSLRKYT